MELSSEDERAKHKQTAADDSQLATRDKKVIQPLSDDLRPEDAVPTVGKAHTVPSPPATRSQPGTGQQPATSPPGGSASPPPAKSPAAPSIYPQATRGFGATSQQAAFAGPPTPAHPAEPEPSKSTKTKVIIVLVRIIAGLLIFGATAGLLAASADFVGLLVLVTWSLAASGLYVIVFLLFLIGSLALGIGLWRLREIARVVYVFIGVVTLILSLFGTYRYFSVTRQIRQFGRAAIAKDEQEIAQAQNNKYLPATQKAATIDRLRKAEQLDKKELNAPDILTPIIVAVYIVNITELVFLSLPPVKKVFD